uniref:Uncharacterized protein n=1 Tax=Pseudonaja textilis TaxID=8673 RepID=A0A670Z6P4_PSETE
MLSLLGESELFPSFHDKVRKIVAEEGRTARNLIAWSVPLENKEEEGKPKWQVGAKSKRINQGTHKISKQSSEADPFFTKLHPR